MTTTSQPKVNIELVEASGGQEPQGGAFAVVPKPTPPPEPLDYTSPTYWASEGAYQWDGVGEFWDNIPEASTAVLDVTESGWTSGFRPVRAEIHLSSKSTSAAGNFEIEMLSQGLPADVIGSETFSLGADDSTVVVMPLTFGVQDIQSLDLNNDGGGTAPVPDITSIIFFV